MRLTFFGAGGFAIPSLRALCSAKKNAETAYEICGVFCPPPRPAKRGLQMASCVLAQAAGELNLPVTEGVTTDAVLQSQALSPQAIIVCDYGGLLPRALWQKTHWGAINIHASLLPRWRGASPITQAILAGDATSGVTIMQMNEKLDAGDIIAQEKMAISPNMTGGELSSALADMGGKLLCQTLAQLQKQSADSHSAQDWKTPQNSTDVTFAAKLTAASRQLDFRHDAVALCRQVRAFAPTPGARIFMGGELLKVLQAQVIENNTVTNAEVTNEQAGKILRADKDGILIACGRGALQLLRVQRAGGKIMNAADFIRGKKLPPNADLPTE